jgi:hypothetical protein
MKGYLIHGLITAVCLAAVMFSFRAYDAHKAKKAASTEA